MEIIRADIKRPGYDLLVGCHNYTKIEMEWRYPDRCY